MRRRKVEQIDNEYVRQQKKQEARRRQRVRQLKKRMTVYLVGLVIVVIGFATVYIGQNKKYDVMLAEKATLEKQLTEVEKEQEKLQHQLEKLDDDEYIEKLARQQYLVGKEGEIIFSIPEEKVEREKNETKSSY